MCAKLLIPHIKRLCEVSVSFLYHQTFHLHIRDQSLVRAFFLLFIRYPLQVTHDTALAPKGKNSHIKGGALMEPD